ncbi:MAG TPA: efflux RND transporter periplasmic adaptor subunit [Rhodocyclaceae bacterium]|jgi:HlyD family secretion protein|nr:efflux RND transporter periplasmic adaptor subunit [Rhodocyclaceae bacterium]
MTRAKLSSISGRLILAVVIVGLLAAGWWWTARPKPIPVVFQTVDHGKVESTISNTRAGTVESCQRAKLATSMGGRIEQLPVREGDHVKKGQLLMKLWNDDQVAQNTLAKAQVDTAQKRIVEACTIAANAEREARREDSLRAQNFVSKSRYESARSEADARQAGCEAAKADAARAQAQVKVTHVEQDRTVLYAPFSGTVAKIVGEVGEYSTPSPPGILTQPVIDLIDESCLYVKAPMDEADAPKIREGQVVRISFDAMPKKSFPGHVKRVSPYVSAVEKQSRTVDIEATLDAATAPQLLVGYSADVEVILSVRDNVVRVPTSALLEGGRVLLVRRDGTLEERKIKAGVANWEFTEVLEGIAAGDRVVTSIEREGVKPGVRVVADEASIPAKK